jgi:hypothetical protein
MGRSVVSPPPAWRWQPVSRRIEYLPQDGCVFVHYAGPADCEGLKQLAADAAAVAREHGATHFLIDDREMRLELDTFELYELPEAFETLGFGRRCKSAVVYDPNAPRAADFRFFQSVAYNKGFAFRLFADMGQAREWLKLMPASPFPSA